MQSREGLPAITAILVRKGDDGQPDEPGPGHYSAVYPHVGNDATVSGSNGPANWNW